MSVILVVSPHPDDEVLGCGGTLLRHIAQGDKVHWLIVTDMSTQHGFSKEGVDQRQLEIEKVSTAFGFEKTHNLGLPPAKLDTLPIAELVGLIGNVMKEIAPDVVYLPFGGDVHSDHTVVFDASAACTKWFRYPSVKRVLCYETLSETDFSLNPVSLKFVPNTFIDISSYLEQKLRIAKIYINEIKEFPFPRSELALRSLAHLRGAASGCYAAESFLLLREIIND